MKPMGKKQVRDEVVYVPANLYVKKHILHSYECRCHNAELEAKPVLQRNIVTKNDIPPTN